MAGVGSIGATTPLPVAYTRASTSGKTPSAVSGARPGPGEADASVPTAEPSREGTQPAKGATARELTEEEQQQVDQLKQRDREVRSHEQAHSAAAGRYANGGPQFEFTTGPDGRQYATGGHVNIDVGPANTPEATLIKAQVIRRAALAPADPSGQDRSVASAATQLERDARKQIQEARNTEAEGGEGEVLPRRALAQYVEGGGGAGAAMLDLQA
jgi:hypothetical protein